MQTQLLSEAVGKTLLAHGWTLASAESCTGGGIAAAITDIAGSSQWFERGFITYSNQAKQDMLDVSTETLMVSGAVSEATVREMVSGALAHSQAQVAVAVSGIAGPDGGTPEKPVGMVCLAWGVSGKPATACTEYFTGDRHAVRMQAVQRALQGLLDILEEPGA